MAVPGTNGTPRHLSEQTPLLREEPASIKPGDRQEQVQIEEPSTRELLVILCSIWMGVFLAALGMYQISAEYCILRILYTQIYA